METPHSAALMSKHAGLDARIAEETRRPQPDLALVATLKKRKLRIKDEIVRD